MQPTEGREVQCVHLCEGGRPPGDRVESDERPPRAGIPSHLRNAHVENETPVRGPYGPNVRIGRTHLERDSGGRSAHEQRVSAIRASSTGEPEDMVGDTTGRRGCARDHMRVWPELRNTAQAEPERSVLLFGSWLRGCPRCNRRDAEC